MIVQNEPLRPCAKCGLLSCAGSPVTNIWCRTWPIVGAWVFWVASPLCASPPCGALSFVAADGFEGLGWDEEPESDPNRWMTIPEGLGDGSWRAIAGNAARLARRAAGRIFKVTAPERVYAPSRSRSGRASYSRALGLCFSFVLPASHQTNRSARPARRSLCHSHAGVRRQNQPAAM